MATTFQSEIAGAFAVIIPVSDGMAGSFTVTPIPGHLLWRVDVTTSGDVTYATMNAFAVGQGYVDAAAMYVDLGFVNEAAFLASYGYDSSSDFLEQVNWPSVEEILNDQGIYFE